MRFVKKRRFQVSFELGNNAVDGYGVLFIHGSDEFEAERRLKKVLIDLSVCGSFTLNIVEVEQPNQAQPHIQLLH
jgi:hypothetical protein